MARDRSEFRQTDLVCVENGDTVGGPLDFLSARVGSDPADVCSPVYMHIRFGSLTRYRSGSFKRQHRILSVNRKNDIIFEGSLFVYEWQNVRK